MTGFSRFFSSLPFNAVMSVVSVVILADSIFPFLDTQSSVPGVVRTIIWIVLTIHFFRLTLKGLKQAKSDPTPE